MQSIAKFISIKITIVFLSYNFKQFNFMTIRLINLLFRMQSRLGNISGTLGCPYSLFTSGEICIIHPLQCWPTEFSTNGSETVNIGLPCLIVALLIVPLKTNFFIMHHLRTIEQVCIAEFCTLSNTVDNLQVGAFMSRCNIVYSFWYFCLAYMDTVRTYQTKIF